MDTSDGQCLLSKQKDVAMNLFWIFLRPKGVKFALAVFLTLISSVVMTKFEWTSKVTWYAERGFPFFFMKITDTVYGKYCPFDSICFSTNIQSIDSFSLTIDFLLWYLISCILIFAYQTVKTKCNDRKSNF